jgi:hypothetical protein
VLAALFLIFTIKRTETRINIEDMTMNRKIPENEVVKGTKKSATLLMETSTLKMTIAAPKTAAKSSVFFNEWFIVSYPRPLQPEISPLPDNSEAVALYIPVVLVPIL